jgi:hypothetical protein
MMLGHQQRLGIRFQRLEYMFLIRRIADVIALPSSSGASVNPTRARPG